MTHNQTYTNMNNVSSKSNIPFGLKIIWFVYVFMYFSMGFQQIPHHNIIRSPNLFQL